MGIPLMVIHFIDNVTIFKVGFDLIPQARKFNRFPFGAGEIGDMIRNMVLSFSISPEAEAKLKAKAAAAGLDIGAYAAKTLERIATRPSLDEVLAPLRAEFEKSGMTEEELTNFLERTKHEARAEQQARKAL
jgi:hypothetical protein